MTLSQAFRRRTLAPQENRRRFQRVKVNLLGRFMLEDRMEYPCQTEDMSPGSVALITPVRGRIGERVIAYIDQIGRIEGSIVRNFDGGGFVMEINATARKKDKLAAKLMWLANRDELDLEDDRRHERVMPSQPSVRISLPDEREMAWPIMDLSLSGAGLATDMRPPLGSHLLVGKVRAKIVRHLENGVGVEFDVLQTKDSLDAIYD